MSLVLSEAMREFLDESGHFAVVATVNSDGSPHQVVVWYQRRGDTVVVNARDGRHWAANARRTGSMSAAIADAYDYVILRGSVEVVDAPDTAGSDIRSLARRYGDNEEPFNGQRRVTFVLHPDHISVHGRLVGNTE